MLRTRDELFWSLFFPLILGTLFYISFGGYSQKNEVFKSVDVAYISEETGKDENFEAVVESFSKEGESQLFRIKTTSEEEAKKLLLEGNISGIIYNRGQLSLMVDGEGINESILNSFLNQYIQKRQTIATIAKISPDKMEEIIKKKASEISSLKEISFTNGSMDTMTNYFYALIAMSCLYGCFAGLSSAVDIKANLSALAARRVVAPTNKMKVIIGDFLGGVVVQFGCSLFTVFYLIYILKVDFGQKLLYIILTVLVGCTIGIATGLFAGSIGHQSEKLKMSIVLSITMTECFLSGLMVGNMKDIVEHYAPIINRINPAALIVDAFYSLNVYDTYDRYVTNMLSMLVIAGLLCIGSFLVIRRESYASI
jgi:ABC-2 type transport system permease protein